MSAANVGNASGTRHTLLWVSRESEVPGLGLLAEPSFILVIAVTDCNKKYQSTLTVMGWSFQGQRSKRVICGVSLVVWALFTFQFRSLGMGLTKETVLVCLASGSQG